jgi:hypothetical protein
MAQNRIISASIALPPIDRYRFRAAQAATAVGNDGACVDQHAIN